MVKHNCTEYTFDSILTVRQVIKKMRNFDKKHYAAQYSHALIVGAQLPPRPTNLTYMGAQSVEILVRSTLVKS